MNKLIVCGAIVAVCCLSIGRAAEEGDAKCASGKLAASKEQELLAHNVYVALKDNSTASKKAFTELCKKHLSPHKGIVFFAVGTPTGAQGQFNDRDFDISLNMVFTDQTALDTYARSDLHQMFLAEVMAGIKSVRVFDANVERVGVPDDKK